MSDTGRPTAYEVRVDAIPAALHSRPWVLWRWVYLPERSKWTKPPFQHNARRASTTDPTTWLDFADAVRHYQAGRSHRKWDGIGVVVRPEDSLVGVDFDDVFPDPASGAPVPPVADDLAAMIRSLGSYTELSPSGTGLRTFLLAAVPQARIARDKRFEVYPRDRYLTVTGLAVPKSPRDVMPRQAEIDALMTQHCAPLPDDAPTPAANALGGSPEMSDREVIERARSARNGEAFRRLYDQGDTRAYHGDHSAADLALVGMLRFWTQDEGQVDRLMRNSALSRPKWTERPDYRRRTLAKADGGEHYHPPAEQLTRTAALARIRSATGRTP